MSTIGFWFKNARNIALPQSVLPCLTAIILCIGQEGFLWWLALPVLLGVCAAHLGMNLADDYFDYKHDSRTRADISSTSVRARMEKCHYLGDEAKGDRAPQKSADFSGTPQAKSTKTKTEQKRRLSFKEKRELEDLEKLLPELETEKAQLEALLSGGATQADDIAKASKRYQEVQDALDEAEMRWLELSDLN